MPPPPAIDPLQPSSAGFGISPLSAPDPPRPSSAYAGMPFPFAPPPGSAYGGVGLGSSSSGQQQQQPLPSTSSLLAPPASTAVGGPASGSLDLGPRTNPLPAPPTPPKTQAEPPKPVIAPHMQAPFATSTGPPPEITKPNVPQHVPGLDVPFGTERTLQDFLSRTQALENQVVKLSQEKGQLEAEYAKMPLHGGRTAKERSRKAEVEERIEVLNKAISQQRLLLKQMQPRGR
ncbi:hypothetical protein DUNSADRAFT_15914 [Dunaliella salina]|uniref:Uncharacterized protein n=1 Tax=Dunaliella salina TaxID=3046 RepID=A0ABQ7H1E1_DUNSA|nr:hypothetical protein DUNSADRAFT_15914 [Dunaliella salina]|eukprot:KAF5840671.1 hypothetical protein DUNSADRAFT_15914 [Dunaliella salina]